MKFATVLKEAGFSTERFKNCSEIPIVLYDGKNRIESNDDVRFNEPIFKNNSTTFVDFFNFLDSLEKSQVSSPINIKIDEAVVIVFYKTPQAKIFLRKDMLMDPLDYMD